VSDTREQDWRAGALHITSLQHEYQDTYILAATRTHPYIYNIHPRILHIRAQPTNQSGGWKSDRLSGPSNSL